MLHLVYNWFMGNIYVTEFEGGDGMKMVKEEIYKLMSVHNLSDSEFAEKIGISRMQMWRILNNRSNVGMSVVTGFKKAFPNESFENYFKIECE